MALVMRKSDKKVISVSRKKVTVYEGAYVAGNENDVFEKFWLKSVATLNCIPYNQ